MSPRDTLLRVATILTERGHRAALRHTIFELDGETAAHLTPGGVYVMRVRSHTGDVLAAARMVRRAETAEDIARDLAARALLRAGAEMARRASLTPEQREREDRPACAVCGLRDPMTGQERCGHCAQGKAA